MTNRQIAKVAKEIIQNVLGFETTIKEIVLLESADDGKTATYILFRKRGCAHLEYKAFYNDNTNEYELSVNNLSTGTELFISELY